MVKAIYSSGEYRLVESLSHKLVDRYEWTTFSSEQRRTKVHDVLSLSLPDDDKVDKDKLLPLKFEEIGMIPNMPSSTFRRIWNYAIFLKRHANIVEVNESKTGFYYDDKHFEVSEYLKYIFQYFFFCKMGYCLRFAKADGSHVTRSQPKIHTHRHSQSQTHTDKQTHTPTDTRTLTQTYTHTHPHIFYTSLHTLRTNTNNQSENS